MANIDLDFLTAHEAEQRDELRKSLGTDRQGWYPKARHEVYHTPFYGQPEAAHAATAEGDASDYSACDAQDAEERWQAECRRTGRRFWFFTALLYALAICGIAALTDWRPWG